MSPGTENPQSHLRLHPTSDVAFECDLCDFVAHGPGPLEDHILSAHSVPAGAVDAVPVHAAKAIKKRGRPRKPRTEAVG